MPLTEIQQIDSLIKKSHHILITFKKDFSLDAVSSALALYLVLQKLNKLVDVVCDDFVLPQNLSFLPSAEKIQTKLSNLQKFIINLDVSQTQIDELSYNVEGKNLKIFITPKNGAFKPTDVTPENSSYKYDLIVTLDTPDLDSLGKVYRQATDFFYNTDIVNIDHQPENEHFGQINFTNLNAVSTTEILFNLIKTINPDLLDKNIATCLLTGLIGETRSFKTVNVTPTTLDIASQLITAEADREVIIKSLYRSRSLATLKLWGRVLARLKNESGNKLVWSLLTEHDFIEANAEAKDLPEVIDELISFLPGVEVVALIYQDQNQSNVLLRAVKNYNALYLSQRFSPAGTKDLARFQLTGKTLQEAEKEIIEKIKENLLKTE